MFMNLPHYYVEEEDEDGKEKKLAPGQKLRKREDWTVRRFFLSLLIDHMMTKYIIVIKIYHLHRQLSKEIVKIGQSIQKLPASQKQYSHCSKWEVLWAVV
jgi:hypothetical protein